MFTLRNNTRGDLVLPDGTALNASSVNRNVTAEAIRMAEKHPVSRAWIETGAITVEESEDDTRDDVPEEVTAEAIQTMTKKALQAFLRQHDESPRGSIEDLRERALELIETEE